MKKNTLIFGVCIALLGISGFLFWRGQNRSAYTEESYIVADVSQEPQGEVQKTEEPEKSGGGDCAVYVSGAVKKPGLYRYQGTARVCDAIEATGGFCDNAAVASLNLARMLEDGEQICVMTKKEAARAEKEEKNGSADHSRPEDPSGSQTDGKININTATAAELMTLPGIGEAKAALILNYREEHGNFSKIEDLMQISGIKEGIFQKIKDHITTS